MDQDGAIIGGTSLPAETFTYVTDASDHQFTNGRVWEPSGCVGRTFGSGDFNGDGIQDVYCHDAWGTGELDVGLSDGTSFEFSQWATWCKDSEQVLSTGDFNGDGKTDLACHTKDGANVEVGLSDGTQFVEDYWGIKSWCKASGWSWGVNWGDVPKVPFTADFDGDGATDLGCRWIYGSTRVWVALADGDGNFTHDGQWLDGFCNSNGQHGIGDFNGDGKADLYCYDNYGPAATYTTEVALSDGGELVDRGAWLGAVQGCKWFATGDMNGDGRTDVWCHNTTGGGDTWVGLSDGVDGFSDWQQWLDNWTGYQGIVLAGDFNGDGKTDISSYSSDDTSVVESGSLLGKTDVVSTVTHALGGTTTLEYLPGTHWGGDERHPPPPAQLTANDGLSYKETPSTHPMNPGGPTVASITVSDGRGWEKTATYEYAEGKYDPQEREWLGFGYSKETQPVLAGETVGPWTERTYCQEIECAGVLASERLVGEEPGSPGVASVQTEMENEFDRGGDGQTEPYWAKVVSRWTYEYSGAGEPCMWPCGNGERRKEDYEYDEYGNQILVIRHGNFDASGDEMTTATEYYPNESDYIVNKPARTTSYYGIGTGGVKLSETEHFYDGASIHSTPPQVGLLTDSSVWRNTDDRHVHRCDPTQCGVASCLEYDE